MPRKDKPGYERIADKAARGVYSLVEPLDYLILDKLVDEGTTMGGYYPLGTTVVNLVKQFEKQVPSSVISGQLRSMYIQGLVVKIKIAGATAGHAWQRTERGVKALNEWKERNSGEGRDSEPTKERKG